MQLPLTDPETLFEELLQDLPPATMQMARDVKAFVRTKKIKPPRTSCAWCSCMGLRPIVARGGRDLYEAL